MREIAVGERYYFGKGEDVSNDESCKWLTENHQLEIVEKYLGGKTSIACKVKVVNEKGDAFELNGKRLDDLFVIKIPKFDPLRYSRQDTVLHADRIRRKAKEEFRLTSQRLKDCSHANPIIGLYTQVTDDDLLIPITIQPFLGSHTSLHEWYLRVLSTKMPRPADWITLATGLAHALENLHARRVIHGDVHPGNIFVKSDLQLTDQSHEFAGHALKFIDFGEAFMAEPAPNYRPRNHNPYLAPERCHAVRLSEGVDVFSFGILLLFLATKNNSPIDPQQFVVENIKFHIAKCLGSIGGQIPTIVDLIGRCLSKAAERRPRMAEVFDELHQILIRLPGLEKAEAVHATSGDSPQNESAENILEMAAPTFLQPVPQKMKAKFQCEACELAGFRRYEAFEIIHTMMWREIPRQIKRRLALEERNRQQGLQPGHMQMPHPLVYKLLDNEVARAAEMAEGLLRGSLLIEGSRDHIIRSLVSLFDELRAGPYLQSSDGADRYQADSLTTVTTLDMWQRDALGLGGRLGTAVVRMGERGALLRRALVMSVEELGWPFVGKLIELLDRHLSASSPDPSRPHLESFRTLLSQACNDFLEECGRSAWPQNSGEAAACDFSYSTRFVDEHIRPSLEETLVRQRWYQKRLDKILQTISNLCDRYGLDDLLSTELATSLKPAGGVDEHFVGKTLNWHKFAAEIKPILLMIAPVGTIRQVEQTRADNPAALIHCPTLAEARHRWLLVTVDGRGHRPVDGTGGVPNIHVDRLRIFQSVHGVPEDRKKHLGEVFVRSANIGACCKILQKLVEECRKTVDRVGVDIS